MRRFRQLLSYLLIAGGAVYIFQGARDFFESRLGQRAAGQEFEIPPGAAPQPGRQAFPLGGTVAKLSIPRLDAELYVVEGVGQKELKRGPGHMSGTALPGQSGNCVIAGHRDTHFRVLKDIQKGDDIMLQTRDGEYLYRVKSLRVVSPKNTSALQPTSDAELNLITCYPFYYVGSAPKRFVVEATLAGAAGTTAGLGPSKTKGGS